MRTSIRARRAALLGLLGPLALGACETLDAIQKSIEEDRETDQAGPPPPALPEDPLRAIALLERSGSDGEGALQQCLARGEEPVRVRAAVALGRLPWPDFGADVTRALADALADPAPAVRAAAAFAIGQRGDAAAAPALLERWMDRDEDVRARIVEAASRLDDPRLRDEVLLALGDPALAVRIEAVVGPHRWPSVSDEGAVPGAEAVDAALVRCALGEDRPRAGSAVRDGEVAWRALFALERRRSDRGLPAYLEHVLSADPRARIFAVKGLGSLSPQGVAGARERVLASLRAALIDADWRVCAEAAFALGRHPDAISIGPLARALEHPSTHVRIEAALALGACAADAERARAALRSVRGAGPNVAGAALEAEARLAGDAALAEIRAGAAAAEPLARAAAARALAHLSSPEALSALIELTRDPDRRVAWTAVEGIGRRAAAAPEAASSARERLHELCAAPDNGLRLGAVVALREGPLPADLPFLVHAFQTPPGDVADEVAFNALESAARIPGDATVELLQRGLAHRSEHVRRTARRLLQELAPDAPVPASVVLPTEAIEPPLPGWEAGHRPLVEVATTRGALVFELYADEAPLHVENFLGLARAGYYDGLSFHRVVSDFVVQGGDYRGDGNGAKTWRAGPLRRELTPRKFVRGSLGMPRNEDPDSGGSQLFVTHRETPHLDGRYTLFGQLIEGFEALDAIEVGDRILGVRER